VPTAAVSVTKCLPVSTQSSSIGVARALRTTMCAVRHEIASAWTNSRGPLLQSLVLVVVAALLPSLQVVALAKLVQVLSEDHATLQQLLLPLALVTLVVGLAMPLVGLVGDVGALLYASQGAHYGAELASLTARLTPSQIADPAMGDAVKEARESLNGRAWLSRSVVQATGNVITAVSLTAAIWRLNPLAGIMSLLALLPVIIGFAFVSRIELSNWRGVSKERKYADYYLDQLVYQRSAVELVTLGTAHRMASWAGQRFRASGRKQIRIGQLELRVQLLAALATAVIVGVALFSLALGSGGGAAAAAGAVGVISGLAAIRSMGFAIGLIMKESPRTAAYLHLLEMVGHTEEQSVVHNVQRLEATGISVKYPGSDSLAISDITIRAERGEMIALVGVNGAGKTTTINALLGAVGTTTGRVEIDGRAVDTWPLTKRLSHFGLLNQDFGRYELTVRDSLALAGPGDTPTDKELWEALESA
jgi:ATP-binding cassette, subfamily B, bacterial